MWGGRFTADRDALFRAFNDSLPIDWPLVRQDIAASSAWVRALGGAGVLTTDEVGRLVSALVDLDAEVHGSHEPPVDSGAEDVHSWVEQRLIEMLGDLGKKLHTGRSRNDQVAADLRLWTRGAIDERIDEIRGVQRELVRPSVRHCDSLVSLQATRPCALLLPPATFASYPLGSHLLSSSGQQKRS